MLPELIECTDLAGQYLKVILIGAPAYACYESGKRFLQAQGLFNASLYALLLCAPLNALMHWLFVWVIASSAGYSSCAAGLLCP